MQGSENPGSDHVRHGGKGHPQDPHREHGFRDRKTGIFQKIAGRDSGTNLVARFISCNQGRRGALERSHGRFSPRSAQVDAISRHQTLLDPFRPLDGVYGRGEVGTQAALGLGRMQSNMHRSQWAAGASATSRGDEMPICGGRLWGIIGIEFS
jgi:hypothetical protein